MPQAGICGCVCLSVCLPECVYACECEKREIVDVGVGGKKKTDWRVKMCVFEPVCVRVCYACGLRDSMRD